jgi:hypothetical protein
MPRAKVSDRTESEYVRMQRKEVEEAALLYVEREEALLGRSVERMPRQNKGFDLKVRVRGEVEPRVVEVKGLGGAWDTRGVRMTPAELEAAETYAGRYWLYVVEYATDLEACTLYRIRDPANQVTSYCFDPGWRALDER